MFCGTDNIMWNILHIKSETKRHDETLVNFAMALGTHIP